MAMPKLEKQFEYKGFPCVILFMPTGYRCGYVGIPKEVKIDIDNIGCHGGITYNSDIYIIKNGKICAGQVLIAHTALMGTMQKLQNGYSLTMKKQ